MRLGVGGLRQLAERLAGLARDGWTPAPRAEGQEPLVWLHVDGSWGIVMREGSHPGQRWWAANRIETPAQLLGWLAHLTRKTWFTRRHAAQMIALFERLHPGCVIWP